jgi:uncharacterized damage-inducible protein DinB
MTTSSAAQLGVELPGNVSPAELLYPDLRQELATTRRVLERVPEGQSAWKPHDKSMTLGKLATHLAQLPAFATTIITTDKLDFAVTKFPSNVIETAAELLALFDSLATKFSAAVEGADWKTLSGTWVLCAGPQVYVSDRKATLVRSMGLNHMSHHRAQLGVYLRLLGIAVPGAYGPSADEQ